MIYCTSLHFLRHEQWRTDGTGSEKHHVFFDKASTSTPHQMDTLESELAACHVPGAPTLQGRRFPKRDQTRGLRHVALHFLDQL